MEYGTLVKQIHVDASPTVVYEVISSPEHIAQWWGTDEADLEPTPGRSGVLTQLTPDGNGTLLKITEKGMREQGWEAAVLEECYNSHDHGWTRHLANLATYAAKLATR
jgi:hypothetical protein